MIEIKGITIPALMIKFDSNKTVEENLEELERKLSSTFFKGSVAVVDYGGVNISEEDKKRIEDILKSHNTQILGYKDSKDTAKTVSSINEKKSMKIINKTLRSGQKVEYDGDVVILGDVNPDAYVVASGNIIVMGTLRGFVHAGANGDETAVIMALKFLPQQIRIGSFITRSPDKPEEVDYPEKAYVENNQIVIEKIK
ncbi:MAG: septum site-determining protein MinC [Hydrogenothermaceae bacterium]|nr:septum site-determining protein MinC [Hydrogenothermaceae bacterium]